MTIARVAQDKFEYQDLVSLLFALEGLDVATLEVRSEPDVGEDTEVRTVIGGAARILDIQTKDEPAVTDLARLATHLAHPTARRTDETFLDRLEAEPARLAVFVTSGRLTDDAVPFAAPDEWTGGSEAFAAPSLTTAKAFLTAFEAVDLPTTSYEPARKAHRKAVAARLQPRDAQALLRRVLVLEKVSRSTLRNRCVAAVARRLQAPAATAARLLDGLLRLVREAKATGEDLTPAVRGLLRRNLPRQFGSPDYLDRGLEDAWVAALETEHVLLIGGPPRSGKSLTAGHLADRLQRDGYDVVRASDHLDARRLLYADGAAPRAVLLDDPLGDGWSVANVPGAYQSLKSLVAQTSASQLLLVAQNQTPLLAAAGVSRLAELKTSGRSWVDMASQNPTLNTRVWRATAGQAGVPAPARDRLASALASGAVQVDLGALTHLAYSGEVRDSSTVAEMVAIADQDAAEFGQDITTTDPDIGDLLAAFAIATDEAIGVDEQTLAFVLEGPAKASPGHQKQLYRLTDFGGRRSPPVFPTYRPEPILSAASASRVEALENRRILIRQGSRLTLSHGFYRAAALGLMRRPSPATTARYLDMLQRALFSLDPGVSRAAARNLPRIWAALPEGGRPKLVELAADGLSAIFPAARDLCWRFLIAHFDRLSEKARSNLPQWLRNAYSTDIDDLVWRDGEAWILGGSASFTDSRMFRRVRLKQVRPVLQGLEGVGDYSVSPERADAALNYYARYPKRMNRRAARRLLSLDEAVLRAEAARIWVSVPRFRDRSVLEIVFEERHPRVANELVLGLAAVWPHLKPERRNLLVDRLKVFIGSPAVAVPLVDTLVLFNRVEHFGDDPPWALFGELLPVLLDQLTDRATGAEPRLFTAVEDAVSVLPPPAIVEICRAWIGWLTRTTKRLLRSDYAWGVIAILVEATRAEPQLRSGLLEPLFSHVDQTGAAAMLVHEMAMEWTDLSSSEQGLLTGLLRRPRKDVDWLKAVVLTSREPAVELVEAVLGGRLPSAPADIEAQLPTALFEACVDVHLGVQPFAYLGLSGRSRAPWREVVDDLAKRPDHRLGFMCLQNLVQRELTDRLMTALPAWRDRLDDVFDLLIRHHLGVTGGAELRPAWDWVFANASEDQRKAWDLRMATSITGLIDDMFELERHLGRKLSEHPQTLKALAADLGAMHLAAGFAEAGEDSDTFIARALPSLSEVLSTHTPILFGTYDYVTGLLKSEEVKDDPVWEEIRAWRDAAFQVRDTAREERLKDPVVDRTRWRGPM